jgi:glycosyltransferase involved in cell wall biosynthesis
MKRSILHLEASTGWGGQEIRILRESVGMRRRGHRIAFGVEPGARLGIEARKEGFPVKELRFDKKWWFATFWQLLTLFKQERIDLLNTHSSLDSWIGGLAARAARIPIVRTRHLSIPVHRGWHSRLLYRALADRVVTTCRETASAIRAVQPHTVSVPTGIEPDRFLFDPAQISEYRRAWGINPGQFVVGTACVMRSWKGIPDLLEAARLLSSYPQIVWVVMGGGHEETYRQMARQKGVAVRFTGHLDDPLPAIGALDAFVLLSTKSEGVSQALLQAAYLARPLVATPTGGLKEVCIDQETGRIVPPHSPGEVANAILDIYAHPAQAAQWGASARRLVEKEFTAEKMLEQMENVYHSLARRG